MDLTQTSGVHPMARLESGKSAGGRLNVGVIVLLLGILIVAVGLRIHALGRASFWCDEFLTAEMTMGRGYAHEKIATNQIVEHPPALTDIHDAAGIGGIWKNQVDEGYPPFYVLLARAWEAIFGVSDVTLRALSVVLSVAGVATLFDAVRIKHGAGAGLWVAAIATVAGPQILFAQEARGYSLLILSGAGALDAMARLEELGPRVPRATLLGCTCLVLLLTHYYVWLGVAALGVYAALQLRGRSRLQAVIAIGCAILICAVTWGPLMLNQIDQSHVAAVQFYFGDAHAGRFGRLFERLALLPVRYLYEPMSRSDAVAAFGAVAYLIMAGLFWRRRELRLWIVWVAAVIAPVALADAAFATAQLGMIRYTLAASIGFYALIAAAPALWRRPAAQLIPLAMVLACLPFLTDVYVPWKANWRAVAADWRRTARAGDITVFAGTDFLGPNSAGISFLGVSFYRRPTGPIVILKGRADPELVRELEDSPGVVLVASAATKDVRRLIPGATLVRAGFEPFVATVYRVRWPAHGVALQATAGGKNKSALARPAPAPGF